MKNPALETHDKKEAHPVLIVDKIGTVGYGLAKELLKDFLVVLVSANKHLPEEKNLIHIPFKKRFPEIPDNSYSKIFLIDDGSRETRESAESLIVKARENNCPFLFIGSIRNLDIQEADNITAFYTNAKVLVIGDLFDSSNFFDPHSTVERYIKEARKNQKIDVEGDGLNLNFPIAFSDTIALILKASYVDVPQKVILLFSPNPVTDISLAHVFQKIDPELSVDYKNTKSNKELFIPTGGQHAIAKYNLEEKIREVDLAQSTKYQSPNAKTRKRKSYRTVVFFFLLIIFLLLLPAMSTAGYSALGLSQIQGAKKEAEKGNFDGAIEKAKNAQKFFLIAKKTSSVLESEARIIGDRNYADKIQTKVESGKDLSLSLEYLLEGAKGIKGIYSGKSDDPKGDFSKASYSLKSSIALIQKLKAQGDLPKDIEQKYDDISPVVDLFANSSEVLPAILGFEKEKTYLVLFQNNMELRPGGGFIGSYAILKLKNGRILSFKVQDVYQADGQLKDHVEPPFAIRRYLPSAHLYMRDSNFDPDFVKSAISTASMYNVETKGSVDGAIGIDLSFAKNVISAIGEVNVSDYQVKINKDNLYLETQKRSENNFFPGSTQKKDFLSGLAKAIELHLATNKDISYVGLVEAVGKSISEKHLLFAFQEQNYQNVFTANGWSSSLWDNRKLTDNKINDFLGINEANLGVNKVNFYVSRSVSKKIIVDDKGKISTKLTIAYKNNSDKNTKFGGAYKNYLQLVVPQGANLISVTIDGKPQDIVPAVTDFYKYEAKGFSPPKGLEVEEREELDKSVFGMLLLIEPGSLKTISLTYSLPFVFSNDPSIEYSLKLFKQPGIDSYPLDLSFQLPPNIQIAKGKLSTSMELKKDEELKYIIGQK